MATRMTPEHSTVPRPQTFAAEQWSLEVLPGAVGELAETYALLAARTRVYIPAPAGTTLMQQLDAIRVVHHLGFRAVPHIVARRIGDTAELQQALRIATADFGVDSILLVAGDGPNVAGPYRNCQALLDAGVLDGCGLHNIGFAGFPEGHPHAANRDAFKLLSAKIAAAESLGLECNIVTQFSFAPRRLLEYCSAAGRELSGIPLRIGLAGPTDPVRLLRYARLCGVNASRRALSQLGLGIARLAMNTDPDDQVQFIRRYATERRECNVQGLHVFGFGGVVRTADWIGRQLARRET